MKKPILTPQILLPVLTELIHSKETADPSWVQSFPGEIYSSNHLMVYSSARETDLPDSNRKLCSEFLRLSGKAEELGSENEQEQRQGRQEGGQNHSTEPDQGG